MLLDSSQCPSPAISVLQSRNDSPGSESSSAPEVNSSDAVVPVGAGVSPVPAAEGAGVSPELVVEEPGAGEGAVCAAVRWLLRRRVRATARATTVYLGDRKRRNIIVLVVGFGGYRPLWPSLKLHL